MWFAALPFDRVDDGLAPGPAIECEDPGAAVAHAERLSATHAGAVAFWRKGDPDTGEYHDAVVLAVFGEVPEDVSGTRLAQRTKARRLLDALAGLSFDDVAG